jgi:glycosyltransferase 2 family protein
MTDEQPPRSETLDPRALRAGLTLAIGIGVTAGLIVTFFAGGKQVLAAAVKLPVGWLLLALALSVLSWLGQGLGFAALTQRGVRGHLLNMTSAFLGGDFAALVTPFGSGGIPAGVFCLTREGLSAGESSAIIAMHSMLTGLFFIIVGVFAAIVMPLKTHGAELLVWSAVAAITLVVAFIVWLAIRPDPATAWLERTLKRSWWLRLTGKKRGPRWAASINHEASQFAENVKILTRERPSQLALSFFGLFMSRVCLIICLPVIMFGLGWRGDIWPLLATAIAAMALAIVSPTPGGSGAVEAATVALLATQAPAPIAGAASLLWRGVTYYAEVFAGWVAFTRYLTGKPKRLKDDDATYEVESK